MSGRVSGWLRRCGIPETSVVTDSVTDLVTAHTIRTGHTADALVAGAVSWFTTSRTGVSRHPGMMSREIPDTAVLRAESAGHDIYPFADHRDGGREPTRP